MITIIHLSDASSVNHVPLAKLENWVIQENQMLNEVTFHFIGFFEGRGRISTPIIDFSSEKREGRTTSGRHYQLLGLPGDPSDIEIRALCVACALKFEAIAIQDVTNNFVGLRH